MMVSDISIPNTKLVGSLNSPFVKETDLGKVQQKEAMRRDVKLGPFAAAKWKRVRSQSVINCPSVCPLILQLVLKEP